MLTPEVFPGFEPALRRLCEYLANSSDFFKSHEWNYHANGQSFQLKELSVHLKKLTAEEIMLHTRKSSRKRRGDSLKLTIRRVGGTSEIQTPAKKFKRIVLPCDASDDDSLDEFESSSTSNQESSYDVRVGSGCKVPYGSRNMGDEVAEKANKVDLDRRTKLDVGNNHKLTSDSVEGGDKGFSRFSEQSNSHVAEKKSAKTVTNKHTDCDGFNKHRHKETESKTVKRRGKGDQRGRESVRRTLPKTQFELAYPDRSRCDSQNLSGTERRSSKVNSLLRHDNLVKETNAKCEKLLSEMDELKSKLAEYSHSYHSDKNGNVKSQHPDGYKTPPHVHDKCHSLSSNSTTVVSESKEKLHNGISGVSNCFTKKAILLPSPPPRHDLKNAKSKDSNSMKNNIESISKAAMKMNKAKPMRESSSSSSTVSSEVLKGNSINYREKLNHAPETSKAVGKSNPLQTAEMSLPSIVPPRNHDRHSKEKFSEQNNKTNITPHAGEDTSKGTVKQHPPRIVEKSLSRDGSSNISDKLLRVKSSDDGGKHITEASDKTVSGNLRSHPPKTVEKSLSRDGSSNISDKLLRVKSSDDGDKHITEASDKTVSGNLRSHPPKTVEKSLSRDGSSNISDKLLRVKSSDDGDKHITEASEKTVSGNLKSHPPKTVEKSLPRDGSSNISDKLLRVKSSDDGGKLKHAQVQEASDKTVSGTLRSPPPKTVEKSLSREGSSIMSDKLLRDKSSDDGGKGVSGTLRSPPPKTVEKSLSREGSSIMSDKLLRDKSSDDGGKGVSGTHRSHLPKTVEKSMSREGSSLICDKLLRDKSSDDVGKLKHTTDASDKGPSGTLRSHPPKIVEKSLSREESSSFIEKPPRDKPADDGGKQNHTTDVSDKGPSGTLRSRPPKIVEKSLSREESSFFIERLMRDKSSDDVDKLRDKSLDDVDKLKYTTDASEQGSSGTVRSPPPKIVENLLYRGSSIISDKLRRDKSGDCGKVKPARDTIVKDVKAMAKSNPFRTSENSLSRQVSSTNYDQSLVDKGAEQDGNTKLTEETSDGTPKDNSKPHPCKISERSLSEKWSICHEKLLKEKCAEESDKLKLTTDKPEIISEVIQECQPSITRKTSLFKEDLTSCHEKSSLDKLVGQRDSPKHVPSLIMKARHLPISLEALNKSHQSHGVQKRETRVQGANLKNVADKGSRLSDLFSYRLKHALEKNALLSTSSEIPKSTCKSFDKSLVEGRIETSSEPVGKGGHAVEDELVRTVEVCMKPQQLSKSPEEFENAPDSLLAAISAIHHGALNDGLVQREEICHIPCTGDNLLITGGLNVMPIVPGSSPAKKRVFNVGMEAGSEECIASGEPKSVIKTGEMLLSNCSKVNEMISPTGHSEVPNKRKESHSEDLERTVKPCEKIPQEGPPNCVGKSESPCKVSKNCKAGRSLITKSKQMKKKRRMILKNGSRCCSDSNIKPRRQSNCGDRSKINVVNDKSRPEEVAPMTGPSEVLNEGGVGVRENYDPVIISNDNSQCVLNVGVVSKNITQDVDASTSEEPYRKASDHTKHPVNSGMSIGICESSGSQLSAVSLDQVVNLGPSACSGKFDSTTATNVGSECSKKLSDLTKKLKAKGKRRASSPNANDLKSKGMDSEYIIYADDIDQLMNRYEDAVANPRSSKAPREKRSIKKVNQSKMLNIFGKDGLDEDHESIFSTSLHGLPEKILEASATSDLKESISDTTCLSKNKNLSLQKSTSSKSDTDGRDKVSTTKTAVTKRRILSESDPKRGTVKLRRCSLDLTLGNVSGNSSNVQGLGVEVLPSIVRETDCNSSIDNPGTDCSNSIVQAEVPIGECMSLSTTVEKFGSALLNAELEISDTIDKEKPCNEVVSANKATQKENFPVESEHGDIESVVPNVDLKNKAKDQILPRDNSASPLPCDRVLSESIQVGTLGEDRMMSGHVMRNEENSFAGEREIKILYDKGRQCSDGVIGSSIEFLDFNLKDYNLLNVGEDIEQMELFICEKLEQSNDMIKKKEEELNMFKANREIWKRKFEKLNGIECLEEKLDKTVTKKVIKSEPGLTDSQQNTETTIQIEKVFSMQDVINENDDVSSVSTKVIDRSNECQAPVMDKNDNSTGGNCDRVLSSSGSAEVNPTLPQANEISQATGSHNSRSEIDSLAIGNSSSQSEADGDSSSSPQIETPSESVHVSSINHPNASSNELESRNAVVETHAVTEIPSVTEQNSVHCQSRSIASQSNESQSTGKEKGIRVREIREMLAPPNENQARPPQTNNFMHVRPPQPNAFMSSIFKTGEGCKTFCQLVGLMTYLGKSVEMILITKSSNGLNALQYAINYYSSCLFKMVIICLKNFKESSKHFLNVLFIQIASHMNSQVGSFNINHMKSMIQAAFQYHLRKCDNNYRHRIRGAASTIFNDLGMEINPPEMVSKPAGSELSDLLLGVGINSNGSHGTVIPNSLPQPQISVSSLSDRGNTLSGQNCFGVINTPAVPGQPTGLISTFQAPACNVYPNRLPIDQGDSARNAGNEIRQGIPTREISPTTNGGVISSSSNMSAAHHNYLAPSTNRLGSGPSTISTPTHHSQHHLTSTSIENPSLLTFQNFAHQAVSGNEIQGRCSAPQGQTPIQRLVGMTGNVMYEMAMMPSSQCHNPHNDSSVPTALTSVQRQNFCSLVPQQGIANYSDQNPMAQQASFSGSNTQTYSRPSGATLMQNQSLLLQQPVQMSSSILSSVSTASQGQISLAGLQYSKSTCQPCPYNYSSSSNINTQIPQPVLSRSDTASSSQINTLQQTTSLGHNDCLNRISGVQSRVSLPLGNARPHNVQQRAQPGLSRSDAASSSQSNTLAQNIYHGALGHNDCFNSRPHNVQQRAQPGLSRSDAASSSRINTYNPLYGYNGLNNSIPGVRLGVSETTRPHNTQQRASTLHDVNRSEIARRASTDGVTAWHMSHPSQIVNANATSMPAVRQSPSDQVAIRTPASQVTSQRCEIQGSELYRKLLENNRSSVVQQNRYNAGLIDSQIRPSCIQAVPQTGYVLNNPSDHSSSVLSQSLANQRLHPCNSPQNLRHSQQAYLPSQPNMNLGVGSRATFPNPPDNAERVSVGSGLQPIQPTVPSPGHCISPVSLVQESDQQRKKMPSSVSARQRTRKSTDSSSLKKQTAKSRKRTPKAGGQSVGRSLSRDSGYRSPSHGAEMVARDNTACVCFVCHRASRLTCSACLAIFYCKPECQKADWERHKASCKPPAS